MEWAVELENVKFSWSSRMDDLVLDIPSLKIKANTFTFLKGPSGSGKTTLLNLLGGVTTPQQGTVKVLGNSLDSLSPSKRDHLRADQIGFIFQMFNLVPYLSAMENVLLSTFFSKRRKAQLAGNENEEAVRLLNRLGIPKNRFQSPVNELSVGQQQRVAAARAFLGKPRMLIADEPTSSLDSDRKDEFIQLLKEECKSASMSLIFVSHDPSLEPHFDQVIELMGVNKAAKGVRS